MCALRFLAVAFVLLTVWCEARGADAFVQFDGGQVTVCPAVGDALDRPPPPTAAGCRAASALEVDLHRQTLWLLGTITPARDLRQSAKPIGLFVSAKGATRVYLNGKALASNGQPALDRAGERPGRIDAVLHVPHDQLLPGANQLAVLVSGHHSWFRSDRALLTLGFFAYLEPPYHEWDDAWPTLVTGGIFALAALYAGLLAAFRVCDAAPLALAAAASLAAGQVAAETLRSLWSYPYPIHDLRLAALVLCGLGVGLTLAAHVHHRLKMPRPWLALGGVALLSLVGVLLAGGFDGKASVAMLVPTVYACACAARQAVRGDRAALAYGVAFAAFAVLNVLDPGQFLDTRYFFVLALLVLLLTALQAVAFRDAVREREAMAQRREQLEAALRQAQQPSNPHLLVRHAGATERVPCDEIVNLSAAGDYTVVQTYEGRKLLHTASLTALERELPSSFLRVHRAHIVNADRVASLKRLRGGTGELSLKGGTTVPVSRRIMPRVRDALTEGDASLPGRRSSPLAPE